jgi:hypothetical protein
MTMAEFVYILCAATSTFCAFLLLRSYHRQRSRLLLLSGLCFLGLAVNGLILVLDLMVLPQIDLRLLRTLVAFVSVLVFLLGLIWESH